MAFVFAGVVSVGLGCTAPLPDVQNATLVRTVCPDVESDDYYFERGSLAADQATDHVLRATFTKYLRGAGAASLSCGGNESGLAYRILWIDSVQAALAIEARSGVADQWVLNSAAFAGLTSLSPWNEARRKTEEAAAQTFEPVEQCLAQQLWRGQPNTARSAHAAAMVLEGRRGRGYRAIAGLPGRRGTRDMCDCAHESREGGGASLTTGVRLTVIGRMRERRNTGDLARSCRTRRARSRSRSTQSRPTSPPPAASTPRACRS